MRKADAKPPDQTERSLITDPGMLDENLLVEAAAGTGKTTALIDRMIALLRHGRCRVDTLAAVTFTRKAAAELQARFQVELERAAREAKQAVERDRLRAALEHIERCYLGTIHSFCARLLRGRPVEAGVDVGFVEIEEDEDLEMRREAWAEYTARLYATDSPRLQKLEELGLATADLQSAFLRFAEYPDVDEWPASAVAVPASGSVVAALRKIVEATVGIEPGNDKLLERHRLVGRLLRVRDTSLPAGVGEVLELVREFASERDVVHKQWPKGKAQAEAERDRWNRFAREQAAPWLAQWRAHRYAELLPMLVEARQVYDQRRADAGALNFQDLLMRAARLLREQPHVRRYFRRRFTHLLVDEFQDTDPIQAEVMMLLTAKDLSETDWRKCRSDKGALFVVGDPKQSIYRFRRADIATYNEVRRMMGRVVSLTANFRAVAPLIEWVNETFDREAFFPKTGGEFGPGYAPLLVGRSDVPPKNWPPVMRLEVPVEPGNQDDIAGYEADLIARTIRAALDARLPVPRTKQERQQGDSAEVQPGDFMIVTRVTKRLSVYAQALQRLGIPHVVTGGTALNEGRGLRLLHVALRAVLEPDNPVALVALLRSELFGVSDRALFEHRRAGGRFDWRAKSASELAETFERLQRFSEWFARLPAIAALERMANDLGLPALTGLVEGGDIETGALGKAIELLRARAGEGTSPAELAEALEELIEQGVKHDALPATSPAASAVRVMNLHKVKGLEAPVVFLADPSGEGEHEVEIHVDRQGARVRGYLALFGEGDAYGRAAWLAHASDWSQYQEREAKFLEAEGNRLLYVAATRAGTRLIVSQRAKGNEKNPWSAFADRLEKCPRLPDPGPQSVPKRATSPGADASQIATAWQRVTTPTYDVKAARLVLAGARALPSLPPTAESERGMGWGAVTHLLLQRLMTGSESGLEAMAAAALVDHGLEPSLAMLAVETARRVCRSELWRRAQAAKERLTETPFEILWPGDGGLPTLVRGVIDLAFREAAGWVIVDYKTDDTSRRKVETLVEQYTPQVQVYRRVWQESVGQTVAEAGLYFTQVDRYVVV